MASEVLKLAAEIVTSHASMTELTPKELLQEIREVYRVLTSLAEPVAAPAAMAPAAPAVRTRKPRKVKMVESPEARAVEEEDGPPLGDPDYMEFMESREG